MNYTCEEGYTVTGFIGGDSYFEMRCVSRCDLDYVVPGAETCEPVFVRQHIFERRPSCNISFMYKETVVVTCDAGYPTNGSNDLANSNNVTFGGDTSFTGLDTRCTVVQCSMPEIPHATVQGGTTFGEHRNEKCEVGYTVTKLGGDERIQTIECVWKRGRSVF